MEGFWTAYFAVIAAAVGVAVGVNTRPARFRAQATITADPDDTRFCRDCRWAAAPPAGLLGRPDFVQAKCMHPQAARNSGGEFLTTGQYRPDSQYACAVMRVATCGKTGTFWERKA
jgi:hypothetical protein